ncbi:MAG: hypothetical protein D6710_02465 [Nitrospirae bacterium]|nr:MAG: hypothetical protein D6710_02465 [Nitrospirota bacterium]
MIRGKGLILIVLACLLFLVPTYALSQGSAQSLAHFACNSFVRGEVDRFLNTLEFFNDIRPPYEVLDEMRMMEEVVSGINRNFGKATGCKPMKRVPEGRYLTLYFQSADDEYWALSSCKYYHFSVQFSRFDSLVTIAVCAYGREVVRGVQLGFKEPDADIIKELVKLQRNAPILISGKMEY